jgi:hypothetical protein
VLSHLPCLAVGTQPRLVASSAIDHLRRRLNPSLLLPSIPSSSTVFNPPPPFLNQICCCVLASHPQAHHPRAARSNFRTGRPLLHHQRRRRHPSPP